MVRPKATDPKTRKLINKLARLQLNGAGKCTTGWEKDFLKDVKQKVSTYGSAFCDQDKGNLDESLSVRQYYKMREIDRMIRFREKMKTGGRK